MNKIYALLFSTFFLLSGCLKASTISTSTIPGVANLPDGIKISGKVTDSQTRETIIGAIITLKNTTNGTITDVDGKYSITVPDANSVLVFSFIGYTPKEIVVGTQTTIDVALVQIATQLEQVVVVGYGVQKKVDLTGAVSAVDTKNMNLMPVQSVAQALQGRTSGVQIIQNSGSPGSSTSVNIRGMGTINNSQPLYVVDGMPLEDIRFLSMDDVKDISILKDAASCAIYGSRGANGVILITSKRGDAGKIKVDFTSSFSINKFWNTYQLMDTTQWLDTRALYYKGTPYEDYTTQFTTKYAVNDWFKEVTNDYGTNQKYNLSISGGSDKTKYLMSVTNSSDQGIMQKASFRQTNFRLNLDNNLTPKIVLQTNFNFANSVRKPTFEGKDNVFQQILRQPPVDRIYEALYDNPSRPDSVVLGPSYVWGSLYAKVQSLQNEETTNNLTGGLNLTYNASKTFSLTTRGNIYVNYFDGNYFNTSSKSYLFPFSSEEKNTIAKQISSNQTFRWSWEIIIHKNLTLHEKHHLDFTGVASLEGQNYHDATSRKYGYISDVSTLRYLNPGNNIDYARETAKSYTTVSFVGRVIYDYSNRYNIQLNARADGSSFFSEDLRWGFFPSVSAGWSLSNESFMKNLGLNWLSLLKFRASYGMLGNNRIEEYSNYDLVRPLGEYIFGRSPVLDMGWTMSGYGNPNIVWEKTSTTNAGFDLNLFKNRFTTSVDFYVKTTSDMLLQVPLPYSIGIGEETNGRWQNTGEVKNSGMDLSMSYTHQVGEVTLKISGNYTTFINKVVKLGERNEPIYGAKIDDYYISNYLGYLTYTAPGYPIGQFYGFKTDGIFTTEEEPNIKYTPQGYNTVEGINMPQAGDFKFKDLNGDGKIDNNDMTILGSPHPDFLYSFAFEAQYSGFDLSVSFQGSEGNKIFNATRFYTAHFYAESDGGKPINPLNNLTDLSWTPEHQDRPYPAIKPNDYNNNYRASDFYIEDGSYLRLKSLQIGYTFPEDLISRAKMRSLRVYVGGYNLLTFTQYTGLDPEIGKDVDVNNKSNNLFFGVDRGNYPMARSYTFGLIIGI